MLLERHVFHEDLGKIGGERLLDWCRAHGADAFTFTVIGSAPDLAHQAAAIETPLESYALPSGRIRAIPEGEPGSLWTKVPVLWELTDETEAILRACFPDGLLTYVPTLGSWCEDPCLFRGEELMLGVISHEHEGVLRIEARQQLALDQADLPYRLKGEWVGY